MALETAEGLLPFHIAAGRRVASTVRVLTAVVGGKVKYRLTREQAIDGIRSRQLRPLGGKKPVIHAVVESHGPESPLLEYAERRRRDVGDRLRALRKFTTEEEDWDNPEGQLKYRRFGAAERVCSAGVVLSLLDDTNRSRLLKAIQRQER